MQNRSSINKKRENREFEINLFHHTLPPNSLEGGLYLLSFVLGNVGLHNCWSALYKFLRLNKLTWLGTVGRSDFSFNFRGNSTVLGCTCTKFMPSTKFLISFIMSKIKWKRTLHSLFFPVSSWVRSSITLKW